MSRRLSTRHPRAIMRGDVEYVRADWATEQVSAVQRTLAELKLGFEDQLALVRRNADKAEEQRARAERAERDLSERRTRLQEVEARLRRETAIVDALLAGGVRTRWSISR